MPSDLSTLFKENQIWLAESSSSPQLKNPNLPYTNTPNLTQNLQNHHRLTTPFNIAEIDLELTEKGLTFGSIHEFILKHAANSLTEKILYSPHSIICFLIANSIKTLLKTSSDKSFNKYIIWVGEECWPSPFLLTNFFTSCQTSSDLLAHCLFLKNLDQNKLCYILDALLCSSAVASIVAYLPTLSRSQEKRFAMRIKSQDIFALFVRNQRALLRPSAAKTRWSVTPATSKNDTPTWQLNLLNQKGPQSFKRNWLMELDSSTNNFCLKYAQSSEPEKSFLRKVS